MGRSVGVESAVGGLRGAASVDGGLGHDEVVWGQGDGRLGGGEEKAELVGDEVSGEGGVLDAFFEDEAVVDGGDGDGGGAKVDY